MQNILFVVLGHIFVVLGAIGAIPLNPMPTVPFLIVASACYARGSKRLHAKLHNSKVLGRYLREWEEYGIIPLHAKLLAVTTMNGSIGWLAYAKSYPVYVDAGLIIVSVCVSVYIVTRPERREDE